MKSKRCRWCGKKFKHIHKYYYCSKKCYTSHYILYQRQYMKKYSKQQNVKLKRKLYYLNNPDKFNQNKDYIKKYGKKYREEHKDVC